MLNSQDWCPDCETTLGLGPCLWCFAHATVEAELPKADLSWGNMTGFEIEDLCDEDD